MSQAFQFMHVFGIDLIGFNKLLVDLSAISGIVERDQGFEEKRIMAHKSSDVRLEGLIQLVGLLKNNY